ncbi:MAG: PHP domain-containing protein [Candidatus Dormibacteria bacterium]
MHCHTFHSADGTVTFEELAQGCAEHGIGRLCVTDHNTISGALQMRERYPELVIVGEEVRTAEGEIIGLYLERPVPPDLPLLETAKRIRDQGAVTYIPHPLDPFRMGVRESGAEMLAAAGLLDAVEVFNRSCRHPNSNHDALTLARRLGLPGGAGGDVHHAGSLGVCWNEVPAFDGPEPLRSALRHNLLGGLAAQILGGER